MQREPPRLAHQRDRDAGRPGHRISYSYDALGRTLTATKGSAQRSYTYNRDGVLVSHMANGAETRFTHDLAT